MNRAVSEILNSSCLVFNITIIIIHIKYRNIPERFLNNSSYLRIEAMPRSHVSPAGGLGGPLAEPSRQGQQGQPQQGQQEGAVGKQEGGHQNSSLTHPKKRKNIRNLHSRAMQDFVVHLFFSFPTNIVKKSYIKYVSNVIYK